MSSARELTATNLKPRELVMDTRGGKDARYYCLPPFRGDRSRPAQRGGGFPWHLVFQGHTVGVFNSWPQAKTSLSGYPASGNQGFFSEEECIAAWQEMCVLGIHPHPVDPAFVDTPTPEAAPFVNITPRKSTPRRSASSSPVKRGPVPGDEKVLADLKRYCSPILPPPPSPSTSREGARSVATDEGPYVNFAIRGGGVISSSAERSARRYRQLQQQGEQPDMLVTRSLEQATLFALEEDADEGGHEN